eukprot:TRINITY_DN1011_c0_g1_i2.p2 TRINITY_DN1011_c0_g1~~TRINITY_DN1011_c0_g1_i2.p2  ORF type:complete len:182 (+),score=72.25 TRINITY_DN1011_c0_g1_i2:762-1307(+)
MVGPDGGQLLGKRPRQDGPPLVTKPDDPEQRAPLEVAFRDSVVAERWGRGETCFADANVWYGQVDFGRADVAAVDTNSGTVVELLEVKHQRHWKQAFGQALANAQADTLTPNQPAASVQGQFSVGAHTKIVVHLFSLPGEPEMDWRLLQARVGNLCEKHSVVFRFTAINEQHRNTLLGVRL